VAFAQENIITLTQACRAVNKYERVPATVVLEVFIYWEKLIPLEPPIPLVLTSSFHEMLQTELTNCVCRAHFKNDLSINPPPPLCTASELLMKMNEALINPIPKV
jgi:hypothetical protein